MIFFSNFKDFMFLQTFKFKSVGGEKKSVGFKKK